MRATFTTSRDARGSTATQRRYVVVDARDAEIRYRTDNKDAAVKRATSVDRWAQRILPLDVIDTHTGEMVHKA